MKNKISNIIYMFFRILGSAWLAFIVDWVPLYIYRGTKNDTIFGENLLCSVSGLVFGFLFLTYFQAKDNKSHKYSIRNFLPIACGAVGIHMVSQLLLYFPTKNNYLLAVSGYNFSKLIATGEDNYPTFPAALISALVFGLVYFAAILAGIKIAHKRRNRLLKDLKQDK